MRLLPTRPESRSSQGSGAPAPSPLRRHRAIRKVPGPAPGTTLWRGRPTVATRTPTGGDAMPTMAPWGSAPSILADTGVPEDESYYRGFTSEDEKAVLTVPMRIQAAWAANDADAFAAVFTDNGSLLMG